MQDILLVTTGVLTALLAGVFFGFAVAVNGGLGRLKDGEYVRAMQNINNVIQNPLFMLSFMGPILLLPLVTFFARDGESARFMLLLIASILYIVGSFGITVGGNVPLNDKLAKVATQSASDQEIALARKQYEKPWNNLHAIRTLTSVAATALIFAACLA